MVGGLYNLSLYTLCDEHPENVMMALNRSSDVLTLDAVRYNDRYTERPCRRQTNGQTSVLSQGGTSIPVRDLENNDTVQWSIEYLEHKEYKVYTYDLEHYSFVQICSKTFRFRSQVRNQSRTFSPHCCHVAWPSLASHHFVHKYLWSGSGYINNKVANGKYM